MNRREFLRRAGTYSAGAASGAAGMALNMADWGKEAGQTLYGDVEDRCNSLAEQIAEFNKSISDKVSSLGHRLDLVSAETAAHRAMLNLLFMLMMISYCIDGGTALFLML